MSHGLFFIRQLLFQRHSSKTVLTQSHLKLSPNVYKIREKDLEESERSSFALEQKVDQMSRGASQPPIPTNDFGKWSTWTSLSQHAVMQSIKTTLLEPFMRVFSFSATYA